MKQFYETYCDNEKLSPLVREIPWTSNLLIMTGCKTDEAREFYLRLCIANRYTKRELDRQIGSMLYERTMISHEKHKDLLAGNGGLAALRDSYVFEVDGMAGQRCFQRWPSSDGMHPVGRNNPCGTKEPDRDAFSRSK